jgi:hypothetical protein
MTRSFKVEVEVDELYELVVSIQYSAYDQREGCSFPSYKTKTHSFVAFNDAVEWVKKNPNAEIKSFVRMENKLEALNTWAKGE